MSPHIRAVTVPQYDRPHLLALPFDIRQTIWQYSCNEGESFEDRCEDGRNGDNSKPPTTTPTSHKLTRVCHMIREDALDLHYQLHSFRLSICQFPAWLDLIGTHAAKLTQLRLGIRCVCQGFDIYSGNYRWQDRQAHLMALLKFCLSNIDCDVSFYYPEKYTYKCIANGETSCRVRVGTAAAIDDRLFSLDDQGETRLAAAQRRGLSWMYLVNPNGDPIGFNGFTRDKDAELLFHPAVGLIYDTIRDMRMSCSSWRHLLADGVVTAFNIPSFNNKNPHMWVHVDYNLAELRGLDSGLLIEKLKLNDKAKIVFINSDQGGKDESDASRLSELLFL